MKKLFWKVFEKKCLFWKNVGKNGIEIAFFYPWATPLASSMILR